MLNFIWVFMVVVGIIVGIATGKQEAIVNAVLNSSKNSAAMIIGLIGIYVFWMGILNIAKESGMVDKLAAKLKRVLMFLFPGVPPTSDAAGYMSLNLVANMLGMGNAATPFGLSAMKELDKLNGCRKIASNAMVMFLVINASSIQILPLTLIAIRGAYGSASPAEIVLPALITTGVSTFAAIVLAKIMERRY
ncbi:MAG: nucleoside recognition domain-containing protein [Eubacteriales bacterium]